MTKHIQDYKETIKGQDEKLSELIQRQKDLLKKNQEMLDRIVNSNPSHSKNLQGKTKK